MSEVGEVIEFTLSTKLSKVKTSHVKLSKDDCQHPLSLLERHKHPLHRPEHVRLFIGSLGGRSRVAVDLLHSGTFHKPPLHGPVVLWTSWGTHKTLHKSLIYGRAASLSRRAAGPVWIGSERRASHDKIGRGYRVCLGATAGRILNRPDKCKWLQRRLRREIAAPDVSELSASSQRLSETNRQPEQRKPAECQRDNQRESTYICFHKCD